MALPTPPNFVLTAVRACGLGDGLLYQGESPAQRIATQLFEDDFASCKSLTKEDLNDSFKSYASLTATNGKITLNPLTKKRIHAMVLWATNLYRIGQDPTGSFFPVDQANLIIETVKLLKQYKEKSKTIAEAAKPTKYTEKS